MVARERAVRLRGVSWSRLWHAVLSTVARSGGKVTEEESPSVVWSRLSAIGRGVHLQFLPGVLAGPSSRAHPMDLVYGQCAVS